jgi:hypothetical protein
LRMYNDDRVHSEDLSRILVVDSFDRTLFDLKNWTQIIFRYNEPCIYSSRSFLTCILVLQVFLIVLLFLTTLYGLLCSMLAVTVTSACVQESSVLVRMLSILVLLLGLRVISVSLLSCWVFIVFIVLLCYVLAVPTLTTTIPVGIPATCSWVLASG